MNKLFFALLFGIMLVGMASASISDLGYYSPNTCVQIIQTCSNCSYNNISSVLISNGGNTPTLMQYNPGLSLNTSDSITYNYSFCHTSTLGNYFINGIGNDGGTNSTWTYQFEIGIPVWLILVFMVFSYGIAILGFFKYRNQAPGPYISTFGGMMMLVLGIYLTSSGIGIYNSTLTYAVGSITLALGAIAALVPIGEKLEERFNLFG